MSLQGTLDTFALPEVLRLLASTNKTGRLTIDGDRGVGNVWMDAGHVVAGDSEHTSSRASLVEVVFELLRFRSGRFVFEADQTTSAAGAPVDVEPTLAEAEQLLGEWQQIEAVVPSLACAVWLTPELSRSTVVVNAEHWRLLATVGSGSTVGAVGDRFGMGELEVSRAVKELVEAGLVSVSSRPEPEPTAAAPGRPAASSPPATPMVSASSLAHLSAEPTSVGSGPEDEDASSEDGPSGPDLARQLAALGPDAARAVAAAARAETPEEREAALASIEGELDGVPISRGLLLKFLSSVRS